MRLPSWQRSRRAWARTSSSRRVISNPTDVAHFSSCSVAWASSRSVAVRFEDASRVPASVSMGLASFPSGPPARSTAGTTEFSSLPLGQFVQMGFDSKELLCRRGLDTFRLHGHTSIGHLSVDFGQSNVKLLISGFRVFSLLQRLCRLLAEILPFILGPCMTRFQRRDLILDSGELAVPLSDSLAFPLRASICCWMSSAGPACTASARVWRASSDDLIVSWAPLFSVVP